MCFAPYPGHESLGWQPSSSTTPWLAYHYDRSGAVLFATEVEALRYAVENHMHVKQVVWGEDVFA